MDDYRLQQIHGLLVELAGCKDSEKNNAPVALYEQSRTFIIESERRAEAREQRLIKMLDEVSTTGCRLTLLTFQAQSC